MDEIPRRAAQACLGISARPGGLPSLARGPGAHQEALAGLTFHNSPRLPLRGVLILNDARRPAVLSPTGGSSAARGLFRGSWDGVSQPDHSLITAT
jgi:hypothetical protein